MKSKELGFFVVFTPLVLSSFTVDCAELDGRYIHSQEQCIRCHVDQDDLQSVLTVSLGKCQDCHETDYPDRAFSQSASGVLHKVSSRKIESGEKQSSSHDATVGMRFPMYSRGSRLGNAPNQMIMVPAGQFIMGTDTRLPDEGPQHTVTLPAYFIDKYEVTNYQYKKFNDATNGRSPRHWRNRTFPDGKVDHPVVYVTWDNANDYCHWAGKRLPTDQEWEKAARGTGGRLFPWGDQFSVHRANTPLRWKEIGSFGDTTPVGSFEEGKSPYGLYDVSGNVWEWTDSWYKAYPDNKTDSESYGERYKTLKGGSWFDCSFYKCGISAPVFNRAFFAKKVKNDSFGFRCAKDTGLKIEDKNKETLS
ncbi:MAG: formylglycine-generating enzyme family protein [Gammaproteobacteria bacterium]